MSAGLIVLMGVTTGHDVGTARRVADDARRDEHG
jgi:hypothetical protein